MGQLLHAALVPHAGLQAGALTAAALQYHNTTVPQYCNHWDYRCTVVRTRKQDGWMVRGYVPNGINELLRGWRRVRDAGCCICATLYNTICLVEMRKQHSGDVRRVPGLSALVV
jgi:hypothetical protein